VELPASFERVAETCKYTRIFRRVQRFKTFEMWFRKMGNNSVRFKLSFMFAEIFLWHKIFSVFCKRKLNKNIEA
jgi:hypothetical protein